MISTIIVVVQKHLKIKKLQEHGLVSKKTIHQTELRLARSINKNVKKEMNDFELNELHQNRTKQI